MMQRSGLRAKVCVEMNVGFTFVRIRSRTAHPLKGDGNDPHGRIHLRNSAALVRRGNAIPNALGKMRSSPMRKSRDNSPHSARRTSLQVPFAQSPTARDDEDSLSRERTDHIVVPRVLTTDQAATLLNVCPETLRRLYRRNSGGLVGICVQRGTRLYWNARKLIDFWFKGRGSGGRSRQRRTRGG